MRPTRSKPSLRQAGESPWHLGRLDLRQGQDGLRVLGSLDAMTRKRVGVLISGRGSNLQALINACKTRDYPAEIVLVISNVPQAQGLLRAEAALIPTLTIDHKDFPSREDFDAALDAALNDGRRRDPLQRGIHAAAHAWLRRELARPPSQHPPSLLPAFRGLHTHERVIAAGCKISGCTVHFVRPEMDEGPIVAQAAVPVLCRGLRRDLGGCGFSKRSIAFILMRLRSLLQALSRFRVNG